MHYVKSEKIRTLLSFKNFVITGLVLSILGLFLPWGKERYLPWYGVVRGYVLGIELWLGTQVFVGCIVAGVCSFFYVTREKKYWLVPVWLAGLFAMYSTLVWIVNPNAATLHWGWVEVHSFRLVSNPGYIEETVDFGAYMSLIGSFIISSSAFVWWGRFITHKYQSEAEAGGPFVGDYYISGDK